MKLSHDGSSSTQRPGRLLMVSAAFPPIGGPGVQRSVKFAKYLSRFGWLPTVWAVDRIDGLPFDSTLLADLAPDVTVHRRHVGGRARLLRRSVCGARSPGSLAPRFATAVDWRLDAWFASRSWPDEFAAWARGSLEPLRRLIDEQRIDAIYSTFSPASNHMLALALKAQTDLPWVADFRDLWTEDFRYCERSAKRRAADRRLEQQILETADAVIGVTPRQTEILANRVPGARRKCVTITNGFDPDDFREVETCDRSSSEPFVLAFVGRFEHYRASDILLAGLKRFASDLGADGKRFVFRVVGHAAERTRAKIRSIGIEHVFTGYLPHTEAVREMRNADALLLSTEANLPNADTVICAKVFEYLASRRPILVVGPEGGECERIVCSCEAGLAVKLDEEAIASALGRLHSARQAGCPIAGCSSGRLSRYSRVNVTRRLASVLDRLVDRADEPQAWQSRLASAGTEYPERESPRELEPVAQRAEACGIVPGQS